MRAGRTSSRRLTRRQGSVVAVGLLAALVLAGCSAAEDAATAAKDAAVDSASAAAEQAVRDAVQEQICAVLGDGQASPADLDALREAVDQAEGLGLPAELLEPAQEVLAKGEAASDSLAAVQEECAAG